MRDKIEKILAGAVDYASACIDGGEPEEIQEGLSVLTSVTACLKNLQSQPEPPERPDPTYQEKGDEELADIARRAAKSNS